LIWSDVEEDLYDFLCNKFILFSYLSLYNMF
jgi:hypothetical protein